MASNLDLGIINTQSSTNLNELVIERLQKEIDLINPQFGKWEQIKKFALTPNVWAIDTGELTPTLKLKRKVILEKYKNLYEKMYS